MKKSAQTDIFQRVEAEARQMAAAAAMHGSSEMRSGKTQVPFLAEKKLAQSILIEAQAADRAWANWKAINDCLDPLLAVPDALQHLGLGALGPIRDALARDSILIAFRLSDNASRDRLTLCRIAQLVRDAAQKGLFESEQWALELGYQPWAAEGAAKRNKDRVERLKNFLVYDWSNFEPSALKDRRLLELRELLKPVRDKIIAHAIAAEEVPRPQIKQIEDLIILTLDLATDAALVLTGSAVSAADFRRFSREQAANFWSWAFKAPVDEYDAQQRKIGFAEE